MRFGKIGYLNLVPFDIFIKKYPTSAAFKLFLNHHKSYPAQLNKEFLFRRIDAGFISSIAGMKAQKTHSAIISQGAVWSVIAIKADSKLDYQSASSNALSTILGIRGEILIGDRALRYKLTHEKERDYVDLGEAWYKKHGLPFAFGLLCYNKHGAFYRRISRHFNRAPVKIPQYLLESYATDAQIAKSDILAYLAHIHYRLTPKAQIALSRFYRAVRISGVKIPRRF